MNAIDLLETQHKEVKALLEKVVHAEGKEGSELLNKITRNLLAHMVIEQEIFYPAASRVDLADIDEGYEEHFVAREMINRAMQATRQKVLFQARCKVLKELIEHHVDEEEDDMFPTVKGKLSADVLNELGARMKALFDELKAVPLPALARRADRSEVLATAKKPAKRRASARSRQQRTSPARRGSKAKKQASR